jgi:hypothetical protein
MGDWSRLLDEAVAAEVIASLAAIRAGISDDEFRREWDTRSAELVEGLRRDRVQVP